MTEEELEKIIRGLVRRKNALPIDSAEACLLRAPASSHSLWSR